MSEKPEPRHILHSALFNNTLRKWQGVNCDVTADTLMYPIFLIDEDNSVQPIHSMTGICRYGINKLKDHLNPLVQKGLKCILIFGVIDNLPKDTNATHADSNSNPVVRALPKLREWFPDLTIACDVCLCPYTSHGHCGLLFEDGIINNQASIERLAQVSLKYAQSGCHIVAPSDMMDGKIATIKNILIKNNLGNRIAVLSYAAKYASSFYGPFRDAAKSKPAFGDRKCHQLPPNSCGLAIRAATRDVYEGADMLMVKPGLAYLDIVKQTKQAHPEYPMFIYQVSGEYAMIYHAAKAGAIDLKAVLSEILVSMRRAGADVIITYFTPIILDWLQPNSKL